MSPQPRWAALHVVAAGALVLRLVVAWRSEFVSYPDEVFQYLEQAHRLVFGYGIVPWEYRYGIRNWLLPGALAGVLQTFRALGLDQPAIYVPLIKSVLAIVSVSIVYASYTIGRQLFDERTARLAAVIAAIWYELLASSIRPTPEVLGAYAVVAALAIAVGAPNGRRAVAIGLLLGISTALRLQYAVPAAAIWLLVLLWWGGRRTLAVTAVGAAVALAAGALDLWTWGGAFASYYNVVLFNLVYGVSTIFGRSTLWYYGSELALASAGLHFLALGYGVLAWKRCWPVLIVIAAVLGPHTLIEHKEYRFVFAAVPLLTLLLAAGVVSVLSRLPERWPKWAFGVALVALVSVARGANTGVLARDDRLLAFLDLSKRDQVAAVLDLSGPWWWSGGFYYMHRDVPLYFREQVAGVPESELQEVASHVLISDAAEPPGFVAVARFGTVTVLERAAPAAAYRRLDYGAPRQTGVEDRYAPTVTPRF